MYYFRFKFKSDADDDWTFERNLTEPLDTIDENEKCHELSDLEIFQVKYLGSTTVDTPKSEKATANAIKSIITSAKCKFDQLSTSFQQHFIQKKKKTLFLFMFFSLY